jgi:uncharacterized membrane protein YdbT with pleckstrin-like domain
LGRDDGQSASTRAERFNKRAERMTEEKIIFQGSPSQILNLDILIGCGLVTVGLIVASLLLNWLPLLALLAVPLGFAAFKWLELKSRVFEITSERVRMSRGLFTRLTDELELYRVTDISLVEPFFLRWLGLGNVVLTTNDKSTPVLTIPAIKGVRQLRDELRKSVEACRDKKRVRLAELE